MLKKICFCILFAFQFLSQAEAKKETEHPPLRIQGAHAVSLKIEPGKELKTTGPADVEKQKDHQLLRLKDQAEVTVKTPSRALSIVLESLENLEIKGFQKTNIKVSLKKGQVVLKNNQGDLQVHLDEGRLEVKSHKGGVEVHSYLAPVFFENLKGSLKISSLRAPLSIFQSQGRFDIQSFDGLIKLEKLNGDLSFHSEKSKIQFKSYKGNIQGYSGRGEISGSLTPDQVKIETQFSPIRLYFANSKARVEAQSWEGKVLAPKNFYRDRAGGVYKASGSIRHRGDAPGYVQLKSRFGKISIL